jgi:uncharacterized protein HemY
MFLRRKTPRARKASARVSRQRPPLDAAGLILELDMVALVRQAENSLRQHAGDADQRERRPWWRRLLGKKRQAQSGPRKAKLVPCTDGRS